MIALKKTLQELFSLSRTEWLLLGAAFVIALAVRLYRLDILMPFTFDQGRDMYALQEISRGNLTLVGPTTGLQGIFLGPFYFYFLLPGFMLSGGSPIGVAYWVAFWTTAVLPLAYLILRPLVGKKWAAFALISLIFAAGAVSESRLIWNPSLAVPTLLISWWSLLNSKKYPWLLGLSALSFGLALQTEVAYTIWLAPAYVWWVLAHRSYSWKVIAISIALFMLTLIPQGLFELRNNFIMTRSLLNGSSSDQVVTLVQVWRERPSQIAATIEMRLWGESTPAQYAFIGVLLLILWWVGSKKRPKDQTIFVWFFTLPIIGLLLHTGNGGAFYNYYLYPHYLPTIFLITLALASTRYSKSLAVIWLAGLFFMFFRASAVIYNPSVLRYRLEHQLNALQAVRAQKTQTMVGLSVYTPNRLPINYQYLSEWLAISGKAEPVNYYPYEVVPTESEYFIVYEGKEVAQEYTFKPWYELMTSQATCGPAQEFGILWLEQCHKLAK